MLQLYKEQGSSWRYWEAWVQAGVIMTHEGDVGQQGQQQQLPLYAGESILQALERVAAPMHERGYSPLAPQSFTAVVVQYRPGDEFTQALLMKRGQEVEEAIDEWLALTGNGYVEGSAWRGRRFNVILSVVEPKVAVAQLVTMLSSRGLLPQGARVAVDAVRDDHFQIAWPEDFSSDFSMGR